MVTGQDFLDELLQEASTTRRVLERVPADKLGWKPHPKSMSLGQLALHLANLPGAIAELATQSKFDVNSQIPLPNPATVEEILGTHDTSVSKAAHILGTFNAAGLNSPWRMMNGEQEVMSIPRSALLRSVMLNHSYHHRGQLTVYLRQVGASVPAVYGPSADENPFVP